jgi:hypothetical protein
MFLLKLKPVRQTIQTTSNGGLIGGLVGFGDIQNGDSVTTKMCSLSKIFFSTLGEYISST